MSDTTNIGDGMRPQPEPHPPLTPHGRITQAHIDAFNSTLRCRFCEGVMDLNALPPQCFECYAEEATGDST